MGKGSLGKEGGREREQPPLQNRDRKRESKGWRRLEIHLPRWKGERGWEWVRLIS